MTAREYRRAHNAIHQWLRNHHGSASRCDNKRCAKKSKVYEWALRKGKPHAKDIKNYRQLCRDCHKAYDLGSKRPEIRIDHIGSRPGPAAAPGLIKCGARITRKHVSIIRRAAKRLKISEAEVVRRAIEAMA